MSFIRDWVTIMLIAVLFVVYLILPILIMMLLPEGMVGDELFFDISTLWLIINTILSIPTIFAYYIGREDESDLPLWQKMKNAIPQAIFWSIYGVLFFVILGFLIAHIDYLNGREFLGGIEE